MILRPELPGDEAAIRALTETAFRDQPHAGGNEQDIVDAMRRDGVLALSIVAENDGVLVGHIAFSPVTISDGTHDWYGLGPVSVTPEMQGKRIGSALIRRGIEELGAMSAGGIVLLGDPAYYCRFGFAHDPALTYPGPPPEYFQRLVLAGSPPNGTVAYAPAFG
ncbi:MAG: GNAT family N-acetyltransferase [Tsuneonella sp.]